ncbi:MAG: toll/interleukin-1 receptor domain-containing protein [Clostridia bacterium]|nr:toll/interleukin-1 receptor domain-containing protein [Clostridia bacterium]
MSKNIFLSYSWDDENHKKWVAKLANDLRSIYGYNATCDTIRNDGELNTMIVDGITKSDKVVVVITPDYSYKADNGIGGVGKETKLLYDRFFDNVGSIIPILKDKALPPRYIKSVPYIDFTTGDYTNNLNNLVKRIENKTEYTAVPISNDPLSASDFDLIPDLRINDPKAEDIFINEQFYAADQRIMSLIQKTKQQYPSLDYKREEKIDVVKSSSMILIGDHFTQAENKYHVIVYEVSYLNKTGLVRFWLDETGSTFGKGIFGLFDEKFYITPYNSYSFGAMIDRSGKSLKLKSTLYFEKEAISTGEKLGEYIYKTIMERIKN